MCINDERRERITELKINEAAKKTGVTVRTLQYYDKIGLIKPSKVTSAGYRIYDEKNLETLWQVMFFRELDFSLEEIAKIMGSPSYDKNLALERQRSLLSAKRKRLDGLISMIDDVMKGEKNMNFEKFDETEIEKQKKQYAEEVASRWGKTDAYKENREKTKNYSKEDWNSVNERGNAIMRKFAALVGTDAGDGKVQMLVSEWQDHITKDYYTCTKEILEGLGQMYTADERFKANINKNGEGTAELMAQAIEIYCSK